jgi:hypothetical protein
MMAMTRILPEGRLFLAVPNSSPMLMVGPEGAAGGFGVEGVEGGFDMELSYARFYSWCDVSRDEEDACGFGIF